MQTGLTPWDFAILLTKVISYLALLGCIGAAFMAALLLPTRSAPLFSAAPNAFNSGRYQCFAALVGLLAVGLGFALQVGNVNQQGIAGMFDTDMAGILAQTSLGTGNQLKAMGFLAALVGGTFFLLAHRQTRPLLTLPALLFSLVAAVYLCVSFSVLGHVATLSAVAQMAIALHVFAAALWIGSLPPLYWLSGTLAPVVLVPLLHRFGQIAWAILAILLSAGVFLLTQLLDSAAQLFTTSYGLLLLGKMGLVTGLLAIAVINKFRLVPELVRSGSTSSFRRAVLWEMGLALTILLLTAVFTTVVGPAQAS